MGGEGVISDLKKIIAKKRAGGAGGSKAVGKFAEHSSILAKRGFPIKVSKCVLSTKVGYLPTACTFVVFQV